MYIYIYYIYFLKINTPIEIRVNSRTSILNTERHSHSVQNLCLMWSHVRLGYNDQTAHTQVYSQKDMTKTDNNNLKLNSLLANRIRASATRTARVDGRILVHHMDSWHSGEPNSMAQCTTNTNI